ncbi:DUF2474 domain-containing protein [Novimethylophilus kurashikiensis]|nr:DUF2474 domain-containing protein [Novimethylophilus kurashikiensis]
MTQGLKRLGWLVLIWGLSVCALSVLAYGLRLAMRVVGLAG